MPRFANQLFAAFAAIIIMAGSFGAIAHVPPAQAYIGLTASHLA